MARTAITIPLVLFSLTGQAHASDARDDVVLLKSVSAPSMERAGLARSLTIFLNGTGVTLTAGRGGSAANSSRVMFGRRVRRATIAPYGGGQRKWREMLECVRDVFSPFKINIVTRRPAAAPYIMAVIGGSSSALGLSSGVTGIAPFSSSLMSNAIVFAFERRDRKAAKECATVAHEVGHALGLRHAYRRDDPMTYLSYNGRKRFQDAAVACGTHRARSCTSRHATQNSFQHIASLVGLRQPGTAPEPAPPKPDQRVAAAPTRRSPPPRRPPASRPRSTTTRVTWVSSNGVRVTVRTTRSGPASSASQVRIGQCSSRPADRGSICVSVGGRQVLRLGRDGRVVRSRRLQKTLASRRGW